MKNLTNSLKRQLEQAVKNQKGCLGRVDVGRMLQLSLRASDPDLAAHIRPASAEEQVQYEALVRQLEEAENPETVEEELAKLIEDIPNLPLIKQAQTNSLPLGLKELPPNGNGTNGFHD